MLLRQWDKQGDIIVLLWRWQAVVMDVHLNEISHTYSA